MKQNIGGIIRHERKRLKYTQKDLAKSVGITIPTLHALEQGKARISLASFLLILDKLGLSMQIYYSIRKG